MSKTPHNRNHARTRPAGPRSWLSGGLSLLALPLLLLSLVLPLGLNLDLCGCEGGGHALFCGAAPSEAPVPERSSCCSAPAPVETEDCASEDEPCPGCPVVELPEVQLDLPAAPSSFDYPLALDARADRAQLGHGFRPAWTAHGSRAPPGKVPRYLLLGRIRC